MDLVLKKCDSDIDRNIARDIIENYHSYVPTYRSVGRRIDYLIILDNNIVGVIGIGSSTYPPCKDVLRYLGINKDGYKDMFNSIGNNWRYCLSVKEKNLGTMVLSRFRKLVKKDWKDKYGDDLKYIITFVGGGHDGAMYKADNLEQIGFTSCLPKHKSVSMKWDSNEEISKKFVKPNGEDRKIIFIHKI